MLCKSLSTESNKTVEKKKILKFFSSNVLMFSWLAGLLQPTTGLLFVWLLPV